MVEPTNLEARAEAVALQMTLREAMALADVEAGRKAPADAVFGLVALGLVEDVTPPRVTDLGKRALVEANRLAGANTLALL